MPKVEDTTGLLLCHNTRHGCDWLTLFTDDALGSARAIRSRRAHEATCPFTPLAAAGMKEVSP